jgi:Ca2+-binding RTX toxin-like protein
MARPSLAGALSLAFVAVALALATTAAPGSAAEGPACGEGPLRSGEVIAGTPCADVIVAPAGVARVEGGGGDDTIVPAPLPAASLGCPACVYLGVGSQTFEGGPGDDVVFGERGNDTLIGGEGNDQLFGGIGDDLLRGGPGDDRLAGGFGADSIDGEGGDDYVRGDGTIDRIYDSGGGFDTLSYATGVTPGFGAGIDTGAAGFPGGAEGERGVYLQLGSGGLNGNDGIAALGGGVDEVQAGAFERVVGSPFSDYIVGSAAPETIYGGGGADVIRGEGGDDAIFGGADGDDLEGGEGEGDTIAGDAGLDNCRSATVTSCEGEADAVTPRDSSKVAVGVVEAAPGQADAYLLGSDAADSVSAAYEPGAIEFSLSGSSFDQSAAAAAGCTVLPTVARCPLGAPLDAIVLAGMGGDDRIAAPGFPGPSAVVIAGGAGGDQISGGEESEDVLVDGPGSGGDLLSALGGDDALLHNGGGDELHGGDGNDLFLSVSICDGELIDGGAGRDNASWARLEGAVAAHLESGVVGAPGAGEAAECSNGSHDTMAWIEDLEGSNGADVLYGDAGPNQLLGHFGADTYRAGPGEDSILANSADSDAAIDCGADADTALLDIPNPPLYEDPAPIECETVRGGAPNNFETQTELPPPPPPPPPPPAPPVAKSPPPDLTPPRTRLTRHPPRALAARRLPRRVSFSFSASEPGSVFRCRIDRRPYRACSSPRAFRVGRGRHAFRVFALDRAGNRDRTPTRFAFAVRRRR